MSPSIEDGQRQHKTPSPSHEGGGRRVLPWREGGREGKLTVVGSESRNTGGVLAHAGALQQVTPFVLIQPIDSPLELTQHKFDTLFIGLHVDCRCF